MARRTQGDQTVTLPAAEFARLAQEANESRETDENPMQAELDSAERDAESDILASLLEIEGSSEVRWQIWRLLPSSDAGFVCELNSAELTVANIGARCGPGKYRVKGLDNRGRYAGMRTLTIAKQSATFQGAAVTAAPAPAASSGVADVLEILRADREKQSENLKSWATILLPVLAPMIGNLFQRKETSMTEMVNTLAGLKQLQTPESSLSKIEEFSKMIEAVRGLIPEGKDTGSTWVDLVRDGIQTVGPALAGALTRQPQPAPVVPRIASPDVANPVPLPEAPPNVAQAETAAAGEPMLKLIGWLKGNLDFLVLKAAAARDPALYADFLLDNLPDGIDINTVRGFLARPDWWSMFVAFDKRVEPYQGWFTQLRDELLAGISDSLGGDAPAAPESDITRMSREQGGEHE